MRSRVFIKLREDQGVAMLVVLFAVVVVTVMGSALVVTSVRDLESSTSVQRASTALGIAEAGVQHTIEQLKKFGPTGSDIVKCRKDSSADGWGQFMNPTDRTLRPELSGTPFPNPDDPGVTPPTTCGAYQGIVGTGIYTVFARGVNADELIRLPGRRIGTYRVDAVGFDRIDRPSRPGERTVQQFLRIETVDVPFSLFAKSGINASGSPLVVNESVYTEGDLTFRDNITFESASAADDCPYPQGCDIFYGWNPSTGKCDASPSAPSQFCPVNANATGVIYKGNGQGGEQNGPIHPTGDPATWNDKGGKNECQFPYDRDKIWDTNSPVGGLPFPVYDSTPVPNGDWGNDSTRLCNPATAGGWEKPPWSRSDFLKSRDLPFDPAGPSEDVYELLKAIAKQTDTYCDHTSSNALQIVPGSGTGSGECPKLNQYLTNIPPDEFFVMYIDSRSTAGAVAVKGEWGPQTPSPPQTVSPCTGHFGIVVVRNGDVRWETQNKTWWGAIFVPEGNFHGSGFGDSWIVGTVFANTMTVTGNLKFQLNDCWLGAVSSPAFYLVQRLRWHETDVQPSG